MTQARRKYFPKINFNKKNNTEIGEGKFYPSAGREDPAGEYRYSCTHSLTSPLDGGGFSTPRSGKFNPGKLTRIYSTVGCVGPKTGQDA
jgi:hypothetical protein